MFPAGDMFLKAELDYRREQMLKARPPRRARSSRRRQGAGARSPRRSPGDSLA